MDPLRKYEVDYEEEHTSLTYSYGDVRGEVSSSPDGYARGRQDDLSADAIARLQADADVYLNDDEWTLIDGYEG